MGQQQLLLVILVTIIVGIATVVAINTFSSAAESANEDAVRQDVVALASDAQGYYMKPSMMEGGGNSFSSITIQDLNCPGTINASNVCYNENGSYEITSTADGQFEITADPSSGTGYSQGSTGNSDNSMTAIVYPDDVTFTG